MEAVRMDVPGTRFRVSVGVLMLFIFAVFTVAPLLGVMFYGYNRNEASALTNLEHQVSRNMHQTLHASAAMVESVGRVIAIVSDTAAMSPVYFKSQRGRQVLWRALNAADQIDAIYVSLENGFHSVVTRIDDDRRKSDARIPATANWHASYIDPFSAGADRARHRLFFEEWGGEAIGAYSDPTDLDIRKLPHYIGARRWEALSVGEPSINPDTGFRVISLGFPVMRNDRFIGFVGANMTLSDMSDYLQSNLISDNSITIIYDVEGNLIASSDFSLLHATGKDGLTARLADLDNASVRESYQLRHRARAASHVFEDTTGRQLSIREMPFPDRFGKDWRVLTIAPTEDFVGELIRTNREMAMITGLLVALLTAIILLLANRIRRAVNHLVLEFNAIGQFTLTDTSLLDSIVRELDVLDRSKEKMKLSLRSFGRYVPTDLVRQLIVSGEEATLGGERRRMTIYFSDIAGFTAISEKLSPEEIVDELGDYFTLMRESLSENHGTVDKYIGDGILALFNAPIEIPDHEVAACLAAIDAQRRLADDRARRAVADRPQFRARIGLDVGEVLVGNIGTVDQFAYTVIGDSVNLASRLEGLCKFYGVDIIGSEALKDATDGRFEWRFLDMASVVGRTGSTRIYELIGEKGSVDAGRLAARDAYEEAVRFYMDRRFDVAEQRFRDLALEDTDNLAAGIMARRARKLHRSPPEEDWTGVYVHTKK